MASNLLDKVWRTFANDSLNEVPHAEGIYAIGFEHPDGVVEYIYVGCSRDIRRQLQKHRKAQDPLGISGFIKDQFRLNDG